MSLASTLKAAETALGWRPRLPSASSSRQQLPPRSLASIGSSSLNLSQAEESNSGEDRGRIYRDCWARLRDGNTPTLSKRIFAERELSHFSLEKKSSANIRRGTSYGEKYILTKVTISSK